MALLNLGGAIAQFQRNNCSIPPVEVIWRGGVRTKGIRNRCPTRKRLSGIKRQNGEISIDFREIAEIEKVSPPSDFGSDGGALYITLFDNILDERGNGIELTVI